MYFEFNGLPGSGKTTICKLTIELLKQDGVEVLFFDEYKKSVDTRTRILNVFQRNIPRSIQIVFRYLGIWGGNMSYSMRSIKECICCAAIHMEIKELTDTSRIIVSSQGILQGILSAYYCKDIENYKKLNKLCSFIQKDINDYYIINTVIPLEVASKRIAGRKAGRSRLDHISAGDRKKALKIQDINLQKIRKMINYDVSIEINTEESFLHNANLVKKRIKMAIEDKKIY